MVRVIKSRRLRWRGHVVKMEEGRSPFKILTGTLAEKRPLRIPTRRLEDNLKIDLTAIVINTRNRVDLAQDRDYSRARVNAALNLRVS